MQVEFAKMVEKNKKLQEGGLHYRNKRDALQKKVELKDAEIEKLKKEAKVSFNFCFQTSKIFFSLIKNFIVLFKIYPTIFQEKAKDTKELDEQKRLASAAQLKIGELMDENRILRADRTKLEISKDAHDQR